MGCAFCKHRESSVSENVIKDQNTDGLGVSFSDDDPGIYPSDLSEEKSQQVRAWNRSLHKMAMTVIDVNSFGSCDQVECREKQAFYVSRLKAMKIENDEDSKSGKMRSKRNLSKNLLNKAKINPDDLLLINEIADLSRESIQNAFQIQCSDSIIADFDPQKDANS